ncbi:hypothetical protein DSCO28_71110 [Desulfosarcina ovata subsp. sediminis]|uniref:Ice-binding protein C-terminal domain-containing protein n=1 Tax=Desulfosarcina ovata subsp. sediminis TaxID=885957 RepID=A0A5K8A1S7_9BACT|nr:PEP-CTERM sorting domain-containing protein [Desulfosarcina ovata]BBO86545.1 hypothetical protein DSCO28_71110 [Desulfosarcina ovata subsp. sediminis]
MRKKSNCRKISVAYAKTRRNKTIGAMATASLALLSLNLSTDANAAIVTGTNFVVDGSVVNSPILTDPDSSYLGAFNNQASWCMDSRFSFAGGQGVLIRTNTNYNPGVRFLSTGQQISAGTAFGDMANWTYRAGESGYIGIKFKISGSYHFGWIEASVNEAGDELALHSWAYEDEAGKAIAAGDIGSAVPVPGSLALLASGAAGLAALRRRKAGVA